jgi:hypothetical protein
MSPKRVSSWKGKRHFRQQVRAYHPAPTFKYHVFEVALKSHTTSDRVAMNSAQARTKTV